jgi:hypothetical protein
MPPVLFSFARNLKISRFTIDVLMQRLTHLQPPPHRGADRDAQLVGQTLASVAACDQLHNELRERFRGIQASDAGAIASFGARFEELNRRISESIARLNSFEYGARLF